MQKRKAARVLFSHRLRNGPICRWSGSFALRRKSFRSRNWHHCRLRIARRTRMNATEEILMDAQRGMLPCRPTTISMRRYRHDRGTDLSGGGDPAPPPVVANRRSGKSSDARHGYVALYPEERVTSTGSPDIVRSSGQSWWALGSLCGTGPVHSQNSRSLRHGSQRGVNVSSMVSVDSVAARIDRRTIATMLLSSREAVTSGGTRGTTFPNGRTRRPCRLASMAT